ARKGGLVNDDPPDLEELERLGQVDPPPPAVLDAAREVLWSAVATEMLATAPDAGHAGEPSATRQAEEPAREPRPADAGDS
ncbi:MAG TPA: hypothetical protein VIX15_14225, partial [Streptosporangiaceae bacterium]